MKKTHMMKLVVVLGVVALMAGCATVKPEEQVAKQVDAFKAAMLAKDIDGLTTLFSDAFEHYEWGDKAGAKDFMSQAKEMGYMDGLTIDTAKAEKKIEGNKASVYPIEVSGSFGSATVELIFTKEKEGWKITGLDIQGL
ncbi:MAG TPA: hypothetical protein PLI09_05790 [Candidatus Hydrogenedentes bacterium]|nr:hypothetical protein [Candidatus Hydrogenedentota bacterium]